MPSKAELQQKIEELTAIIDEHTRAIKAKDTEFEVWKHRTSCAEAMTGKLLAKAKETRKETRLLTEGLTKAWDEHLAYKKKSLEKHEFLTFQIVQLRALVAKYTDFDEIDPDGDFVLDINQSPLLAIYRKPLAHFPPQFLKPDKTYRTEDDRKCMFCGLQFTNVRGFQHCTFPACNTYYCGSWCQKQHWPVHKLWHQSEERVD